jgi:hypothetical protein
MALTGDGPRQVFLHPTDRRKRQKRLYGSAKWERVRRLVLERDNERCQVHASKKCRGRANTVDHIIRPEEGGAEYDPANLRASCRSCNMVRHNAAYFREKVDAAAAPVFRAVNERPGAGDVARFMAWVRALPMVSAEPDDHEHDRWATVGIVFLRGGPVVQVCPQTCNRAPVRWPWRSAA